eukprot:scaffold474227_cov14-Prasinocladus_malaysianus.AAC.1
MARCYRCHLVSDAREGGAQVVEDNSKLQLSFEINNWVEIHASASSDEFMYVLPVLSSSTRTVDRSSDKKLVYELVPYSY